MEFIVMAVVAIIVYVLGFKRGYEYRETLAVNKIQETIDRMEEEITDTLVKVKLEKVQDVIYVYNEETSEFMAQGKDNESISVILKDRFPGKRFAADEDNLREVGFK
jgi:hypothetical protein